jgi:hypothetical protein
MCAQLGHGWLTCPKGNKEMQKKELVSMEERDTAKDARNASRAFRRAQREEEVSEDEGYEVESEAGASVNRDTYSVGSLSLSSLSLSDPSHMCVRAETTRSPSQHDLDSLDTALSLCT